MTDEEIDARLAEISIAQLADHLARRIRIETGELRITIKDGRYQRAHVTLPIGAIPR